MGRILIILMMPLSASHAAPIPATSSSSLISANLGLYVSDRGFSINGAGSDWQLAETPRHIPTLTTLYRSPKINHGVQASLSVRVDKVNEFPSLKSYVQRWMKDYTRLGFEVLASKPVKVNGQDAYVVDVLNRDADKQLRQVVMLKRDTAVIMTCRDHRETFQETAKVCTDIMRTFRWTRN